MTQQELEAHHGIARTSRNNREQFYLEPRQGLENNRNWEEGL